MPSSCTATPWPPSTRNQRCSENGTFSTGSVRRDPTSTGRIPANRLRSATRAERFDDRTAENVASASTSVPPAVASDEIVAQSVIASNLCDSGGVVAEHGRVPFGQHPGRLLHQPRHDRAG